MPISLLFLTDGTDNSPIFLTSPLAKGLASWAFLYPDSLSQIIFRYLDFKFFDFILRKNRKLLDNKEFPQLVTERIARVRFVWTAKFKHASR